ncbi:hypothetical protein [Cryobacterium mannosilyticum]|uniref:Uncharacterized protein n=1 Tax=Cryobacterium mannosilyticum TaxID=1259190 RepID=A0A4R8W761_9MICO|nr:hypothetical protein [Cryobacterium mannosilyticum]TFC03633.1 hypothetical protein E3O32_10050 [Cryobacterium mannosilyticum]
MILHLVAANNGPFIYLDAREDYLSPADARDLGTRLHRLAAEADPPVAEPDEPILYAVKGMSGVDECVVVVSEEWGATIPMSAPDARQLATHLIVLADELDCAEVAE